MSDSFALYFDVSTHFDNEVFANAQTKTSSLVLRSLIVSNHAELDKKFVNVFWRYSSAIILYDNLESYVVVWICFFAFNFTGDHKAVESLSISLTILTFNFSNYFVNFRGVFYLMRKFEAKRSDFNLYFTVVRSKFECICQKVKKNLGVSTFISVDVLKEGFNILIDDKNRVYLLSLGHVFNIFDSILNSLG